MKSYFSKVFKYIFSNRDSLLTEKEVMECFALKSSGVGDVWMVGNHELHDRFTFQDTAFIAESICRDIIPGDIVYKVIIPIVPSSDNYSFDIIFAQKILLNTNVPGTRVKGTFLNFYNELFHTLWDNSAKDERMIAIMGKAKEFMNEYADF